MKTIWVGILVLCCTVLATPCNAGPGGAWPGLTGPKRAGEEDEDEEEPLSGEQLRLRFPGMRTRAEPPVAQGSVGFGMNILYSPVNIGGTLDLYPSPFVRLGFEYALGAGLKWSGGATDLIFAQYGEAVLGVRFFGRLSEADVDLQLSRSWGGHGEALPKYMRPRSGAFANVVPVLLPASHGLFVEGGALTGYIGLKRCTANCGESPAAEPRYVSVARQLVMPFAGLRYVYYSEAYIPRLSVRRIRYGYVFLHALFSPFNQQRGELFLPNDDLVERTPVGMRIGGLLPVSPFCLNAIIMGGGCAQVSMSVGYAPFPAFLMLEGHLRFPIQ